MSSKMDPVYKSVFRIALEDHMSEWDLYSAKENEFVCLKGYTYINPDGEWILAKNPRLKSCCVGSFQKQNNQAILEGQNNKFVPKAAYRVKGYLHKDKIGDFEKYCLRTVSVKKLGPDVPYFTMGLTIALLLLATYLFKRKRLG